jgi:tetratricopeptide (TPR) repeat protein
MSEIKFKVRYSALLLKEFTVADIIKATGLNPESVRTELQRMRQEGLLISSPHPDKQKKRGGRPSVYRLADDTDKLLALSQSVEAFYPPEPSNKPTSRYYESAKQSIAQALVSDHSERRRLLLKAGNELDMAEQAEGGDLAKDLVKNYLMYERARIVYLAGNHDSALKIFEELHKYFTEKKIEVVLRHIDEYVLCLNASLNFGIGIPSRYGNAEWARCLLNTLKENNFQTESPLVILLLDLLHNLSKTADKELIASIVQEIVHVDLTRIEKTEMPPLVHFSRAYPKNEGEEQLTERGWSPKDEMPLPVNNSIPVDNWPRPGTKIKNKE